MNDENTTPRQTPARCIELNLSGHPCGLRAVAGHDRCYIHGVFHALNDGRSTIDIPLLEDPKSILFVYSQVARALAQGAMPAANANGIIRCCNGAQKLLTEMRKQERFEERRRKAEGRSEKAEDRSEESESAEPAASPLAKDQQDQMHATVPPNLKNSDQAGNTESRTMDSAPHNLDTINEASAGCPMSPVLGDMGMSEPSPGDSNGSPVIGDMGAASESEPQPWILPPDKTHRSPVQLPYGPRRLRR